MPTSFRNPLIVVDDADKKRLATMALKPSNAYFTTSPAKLRLSKGKAYSWYLAAREGKGVKGKTARLKFTTLSAADEKSLDRDIAKARGLNMSEAGKDLLIAQSYFQRGLIDDMVKTLVPLYAKQPSSFVKRLLFLGYSRMGNMQEAEKYR